LKNWNNGSINYWSEEMATLESLAKSLEKLEGDRGYFTIEEILDALSRSTNNDLVEILQREHPFKTFHPSMFESLSRSDT